MKQISKMDAKDRSLGDLYEESSPFERGLILTFIGLGMAILSPKLGGGFFNPIFGWFVCAFGLLVATISLIVHCIRASRHQRRADVADMARIIRKKGYRVHSIEENSVQFFYNDNYLLRARCIGNDIFIIDYVFEDIYSEEKIDSLVAAALAQTDIGAVKIVQVRENGVDAMSIAIVHVGNSIYEFKKFLDVAPIPIISAHDEYLGFIDDIKRRRELQSYDPIQYYS